MVAVYTTRRIVLNSIDLQFEKATLKQKDTSETAVIVR